MFKSFFNDMLKTVKSYEDVLSTKGVLRTTAKGMHHTADGLRRTADYLDQKAAALELRADQIEMEEMARLIQDKMKDDTYVPTLTEKEMIEIQIARLPDVFPKSA